MSDGGDEAAEREMAKMMGCAQRLMLAFTPMLLAGTKSRAMREVSALAYLPPTRIVRESAGTSSLDDQLGFER